ncbi:hypothetical protein AWC38_SpisGene13044 [Stylophora pistillata]|uniref:Uncharacterized protein n=1 Tax=Stylophora pistillata TaxID=50429 RepID=A0A2B4S1Q3_STYPI|nr:hypothetical protein AWC38_SpisGene13044 [Stylophora pistillata]
MSPRERGQNANHAFGAYVSCSEVNSILLTTSEPANQRVRKALFTCVVYTNDVYGISVYLACLKLLIVTRKKYQTSISGQI